MNDVLKQLVERRPQLSVCSADILTAFETMERCFRSGGKLLLCGNGGSAADAEHISGELLKGFHSKRPLPSEARTGLDPSLAGLLQGALPAIPLTSFVSLSTAFANDVAPEGIFAQLTWALGREGDVLLGISTSGNARNVLLAIDAAKAKGMSTIGLSGNTGGKMAGNVDVCIRVPEKSTPLIQELHLPVYHCLCTMLENAFFLAQP